MSIVRLHDVSMNYDSTVVLREVFFRLSKGDKVGLIGKNGVIHTGVEAFLSPNRSLRFLIGYGFRG